MAITYSMCDGNTTVTTSITMTESTNKTRSYVQSDGAYVLENYKTLTFTSTVANFDAPLKIYFGYETRTRYNRGDWTDWYNAVDYIYLPLGQPTVTKDVVNDKDICYTGDSNFESEEYVQMI